MLPLWMMSLCFDQKRAVTRFTNGKWKARFILTQQHQAVALLFAENDWLSLFLFLNPLYVIRKFIIVRLDVRLVLLRYNSVLALLNVCIAWCSIWVEERTHILMRAPSRADRIGPSSQLSSSTFIFVFSKHHGSYRPTNALNSPFLLPSYWPWIFPNDQQEAGLRYGKTA